MMIENEEMSIPVPKTENVTEE